ncbi:uncharacterized protein TRAVEDRAFT_49394 [Trametes versicolor FP-101664 SS1]|uniref:uncharacterized protein n=1 Tax=Trametes versicolor (strain FP-101664) TaxID=717944 RepID=UPI0004624793|nr:uncharacterized protein TRAVEDRAFT_49394 [Trametes versicolor FP-101664 SS1]EIW56572.1 hypothetical protein TRAVEDRAFT_49394 [Trametes versicolor FP-101664 SS1]
MSDFDTHTMTGTRTLRQQLTEKITTLAKLFSTLPDSLPYVSGSAKPVLDEEDILELGYSGALNHCFHGLWGYKAEGLTITERGYKLKSSIALLNMVIVSTDDLVIVESWVDALAQAVEASGASCLDDHINPNTTPCQCT